MKTYKGAVFFDFDGTLVDEGEKIYLPTDTTIKSLKKLQENGYMVALSTGRAKSYVPETGIDFDCFVTSNGACVTVDSEYVVNDIIEANALKEIIEYFNKNKFGYLTENNHSCFYSLNEQNGFIEMMEHFNISMECFYPFPDNLDKVKANKMMFTYEDDNMLDELSNKFSDKYNITKHRSNPSGDLVKHHISKAYGIEHVIKKFDIDLKNTYAFGDGDNDFEMLNTVGNSIVMGTHAERLKDIADFITETVINEGITVGLKHFNLI